MDFKRMILRNITALMFGGILLSPFVSNANDAIGHGSHTIENVDGQNHMVDQNHTDLDIAHVGMDGVKSNNGNADIRSRSGGSLETHQENNHGYNTNQNNDPYDHHDQLNKGSNHHSRSSRSGGMH